MNRIRNVAAMFGKEVYVPFRVMAVSNPRKPKGWARFTDVGIEMRTEGLGGRPKTWVDVTSAMLTALILGDMEIIDSDSEIEKKETKEGFRYNQPVIKAFNGRTDVRARNVLTRNGFKDLQEVYDAAPDKLLHLDKMCDSIMSRIVSTLNMHGYDYEKRWDITLKHMWAQLKEIRRARRELEGA